MTWKKIIDTNNQEEYERKAEQATHVFLVIDKKPPYLPIDFCYSVYEVAVKHNIPYNTAVSIAQLHRVPRCYSVTIERVCLTNVDEASEAIA